MKFLCDQCKTRYTISDEKVRGKVLKIRCKNCSNVIEVREPSTGPPRPAPQKRPTTTGAAKAKRRHGSQVARLKSSTGQQLAPASKSGAATKRPEPGRLGAGARATKRPVAPRKDSVSRPRPTPAARQGETEQKTVIAAMPQELLKDARSRAKIQRSSKSRGGSSRAAPVADEPADWYLGDDRGEYGPMTFSELAARVKRGEPGPNAEAWQEGMDDWRPLEEIAELQPYLKKAPPPRPTAQVAQAAPPSPLQKRPGRDPMAAAASAPVPAASLKQRSPTAELAEPLVKPPGSMPALTPTPAIEDPWPVLPEPGSGPAVASLGGDLLPAATPVPGGSGSPLGGGSAAHVSAAGASQLGTLLEQQRKRDRRPILIISVAAVFIAALAVALVIYLISSGKKSGKESSGNAVAQKDMERKAPMDESPRGAGMAEAMARAAAPMEYDLSELDIEIDVSKGKGMGSGRRTTRGMSSRPRPSRPAARRSSSAPADPIALPSMRPKFVGLMSFGAPRPSSGSFSRGGARPGNLGQVVRRNYNRLKRCYEKAARINSRIRNPRLRIYIKVSSSGKVRSVSVSPQRYAADTLGICIRRSIGGWRFPSFSSSYTYTFSARFTSG